jgi:hypothetical protein
MMFEVFPTESGTVAINPEDIMGVEEAMSPYRSIIVCKTMGRVLVECPLRGVLARLTL